jgi:hypothetical protein
MKYDAFFFSPQFQLSRDKDCIAMSYDFSSLRYRAVLFYVLAFTIPQYSIDPMRWRWITHALRHKYAGSEE